MKNLAVLFFLYSLVQRLAVQWQAAAKAMTAKLMYITGANTLQTVRTIRLM